MDENININEALNTIKTYLKLKQHSILANNILK